MTQILIIEEGQELRTGVEKVTCGKFTLEAAASTAESMARGASANFDLIIWDARETGDSLKEMAQELRQFAKRGGATPILLVANATAPDDIVSWSGQYLWLMRPYSESQLKLVIDSALEMAPAPDGSPVEPAAPQVTPIEFEGMIAISLHMRTVFQQISEAAVVDVPVLITGETGTGKDLVAAAIHRRSKRSKAPYVAVNMGSIAPDLVASELFGHEKGAYTGATESRAGLFEQAQHGTLFLDEITTMDEKTQVSLLRVLETKTLRRVRGDRDIKVDVRVVAATNENLEEAVKARRFREDLYYRLDVFGIHLPPLRHRGAGVALLTEHFVSQFTAQYHKPIRVIAPDTYRLLRRYAWPGNVRELKNVIQRAVLMAKGAELTPDSLPARIRQGDGSRDDQEFAGSPIQLGMSLADVEKEFIKMTIASVGGNKIKAAEVLKISRRGLYNKLKRHGIL